MREKKRILKAYPYEANCESCGVPMVDHIGMLGLCEKYVDAKKTRDDITERMGSIFLLANEIAEYTECYTIGKYPTRLAKRIMGICRRRRKP